jgi:hypothetical protein
MGKIFKPTQATTFDINEGTINDSLEIERWPGVDV